MSYISSGLEFPSVNHALMYYESFELNVFKNINFVGEISNNWRHGLFRINVCKTLESCWWSLLKKTTMEILKILHFIIYTIFYYIFLLLVFLLSGIKTSGWYSDLI